jgi:hypothetical protein
MRGPLCASPLPASWRPSASTARRPSSPCWRSTPASSSPSCSTTALVFPSLYLISTIRFAGAARMSGVALALAAATRWALDHLGLVTNPFIGIEDAVIGHPARTVIGLAAVATIIWFVERHSRRRVAPVDGESPVVGTFRSSAVSTHRGRRGSDARSSRRGRAGGSRVHPVLSPFGPRTV